MYSHLNSEHRLVIKYRAELRKSYISEYRIKKLPPTTSFDFKGENREGIFFRPLLDGGAAQCRRRRHALRQHNNNNNYITIYFIRIHYYYHRTY